MDTVRIVVEWTIRDYEGALDAVARWVRHIEEHQPDTLAWDCYTDEAKEHMIWYQEFASEQALPEYVEQSTESGFGREIREYLDFERMPVLGSVSDPDLRTMLREMTGSVPLTHSLGVTR
jgi:hypothetical protein